MLKRIICKGLLLIILLISSQIPFTNALYIDSKKVVDNRVSTTCWLPPSVPQLVYPLNNTQAGLGSLWDLNPYMDWENSTSSCPLATTVFYQYESYRNSSLSQLAYRSGWLSNSYISALGTPEGNYYWRVKAKDNHGNESAWSEVWLLVVDRTIPTISNVNYLIATPNEGNAPVATITWESSELATSNLEWSTDHITWNSLLLDTNADQISHSRQVEDLLPDTVYYFRVISEDYSGNRAISTGYSFTTDDYRLGLTGWPIVINEFLPNPVGADEALMPEGEWVELYNKGSSNIDVSDWFLTDASYNHKLPITTANSITSNPSTAGLVLAPNEFMVVYRDGDSDFTLNNSVGGDQVRLYHKNGWLLIDQHIYTVILGDEVLENKSFARIPDGNGIWFDPIPTPLTPNQLEEPEALIEEINSNFENFVNNLPQPKLTSNFNSDTHIFEFRVNNINNFIKLNYEFTYKSNDQTEGVKGQVNLINQTEYSKQIILGTCSTGGTCVFHENTSESKLKVELFDKNNQSIILN